MIRFIVKKGSYRFLFKAIQSTSAFQDLATEVLTNMCTSWYRSIQSWRSLVGCSTWGRKESDKTERLHFHFSLSRLGEGNGSPLQYSCLENPRDGGAWWAAVYGVAQSWTRLKQLSSSGSSQSYGFSSSHVWMWELDYKERWAQKNWCFWTVVLEKTLQSLLDCKEIQSVHPKGDQSWVIIGRTDVEAETPILWPPDVKSWLIWKDPDAGKDWGQEEKGMMEDEMVGWHHWLNGHEFGWTLGVGDGQGGLMGLQRVRHDWVTELNWTDS